MSRFHRVGGIYYPCLTKKYNEEIRINNDLYETGTS